MSRNLAKEMNPFATLRFNRNENGYIGVARGSDTNKAYDVTVKYVEGVLVAIASDLGSQIWDEQSQDYIVNDKTYMIHLDEKRGFSKSGAKMPAYIGRFGDFSLAYWESHKFDIDGNITDDIDMSKISCILTDVDIATVEAAESFHDSSESVEIMEQADSFHAQTAMGNDCNRPDESDVAVAEQIEYSKALNG